MRSQYDGLVKKLEDDLLRKHEQFMLVANQKLAQERADLDDARAYLEMAFAEVNQMQQNLELGAKEDELCQTFLMQERLNQARDEFSVEVAQMQAQLQEKHLHYYEQLTSLFDFRDILVEQSAELSQHRAKITETEVRLEEWQADLTRREVALNNAQLHKELGSIAGILV